jgi:hypothetical protein
MSLYSGISGGRKAKAAGKATAKMIQMETAIAERRAKRDLSELMKQSRGAAYNSGIQMSGSTEKYLRELEYRGYEGISDIRRIGAAQARAAKKGGQATGSGLMAQGISGAIGALGSAAGSYYTHQQNMRTGIS